MQFVGSILGCSNEATSIGKEDCFLIYLPNSEFLVWVKKGNKKINTKVPQEENKEVQNDSIESIDKNSIIDQIRHLEQHVQVVPKEDLESLNKESLLVYLMKLNEKI